MTPMQKTYMSVALFVGMYLGSLCTGLVSDRYGRRIGTMLAMSCCAVCGLLSTVAPSYALLSLARMGVGVGIGSSPTVVALFSEVLPAATRLVHS